MPGYGSRSAPAGVRGLRAPALVLGGGAGAADQSARRFQTHCGGGARGGGGGGRWPSAGGGARGGDLTPAGEFLANHVLRAHALLAQAARGVGEFRQRVAGSLTVAASGVPATYLLPEVVVAFERAHPGVHVSIVQANSAQTMDPPPHTPPSSPSPP